MTRAARMAIVLCSHAAALALGGVACAAPIVIARAESAVADAGQRVAAEAFRRAGLEVQFRRFPLLRSHEMANNGEVDADLMRSGGTASAHPDLITLDTPVTRGEIGVYGLSSDLAQRTRAQIRMLRACFPRGNLTVKKATAGMQVVEVYNRSALLQMLQSGRCDVVMMAQVDAEVQIAREGLNGRVRWPYLWISEPLYFQLNRRHAELAPRLNRILGEMKREGLIDAYYAEMLSSFNVVPLETEPPAKAAKAASSPR